MRLRALAFLVVASACSANKPSATQEAALLVDKGQEQAAANLLERRLSEAPRDVGARRMAIRVYAFLGRFDQAKRHADLLFRELGRGSPVPWVELGYALELAHRYDEALEQYDAAAAAAPHDALGPLTGGLRAARWGEAEMALPRLEEAVRRDAKNARAWHALGLVRLKLGDLQGAKGAYLSGLTADPQALDNRIGLATVALADHDAAAALAQYDAILAQRPKFGDAQLGRAWALMQLGRLDEAEQALEMGYRLGANRDALIRQRSALRELRGAAR